MDFSDLLKIGDRVVCVVNYPDGNESIMKGCTGTIVVYSHYQEKYSYGVEWDQPVNRGHSCHKKCKNGYGWMVHKSEVVLFEECEDFDAPDNLAPLFIK